MATTTKAVTVQLTDNQVKRIQGILAHRREDSFNSLLIKLIEQGATQLEYHYNRNKVKWVEQKENRNKLQQLEEQVKRLLADKENIG